jgi:mevalonate kinase
MSVNDFTEVVHGKWILSGEHSVLRGQPALVFPVTQKHLKFQCELSEDPFEVKFSCENANEYPLLFWGLIEEALKKLNKTRSDLKGKMSVDSHLPIGTGLGASAALCVGVSKYFYQLGWVEQEELYEFARSLEDLFHGESSGVDIAVALQGQPLKFLRAGDRSQVNINWQPKWAISYCGQRGVTADCVKKVQGFIAENPEQGAALDEQMGEAVALAQAALCDHGEEDGFAKLKKSISMANDCFQRWGLISDSLKQHRNQLKGAGAVATKPTGSGGGGFVLSLWDKQPPAEVSGTPLIVQGPF